MARSGAPRHARSARLFIWFWTFHFRVAVNEDLCALVTDYIHLEGNIKSVYKLQATSELDADVEIPPPPAAPVYPPELPKGWFKFIKVMWLLWRIIIINEIIWFSYYHKITFLFIMTYFLDVRQSAKTIVTPTCKEIIKTASGFYKSAPKYRSKSGSVSSLNSCDSESSFRSYITQGENRKYFKCVKSFAILICLDLFYGTVVS